MPREGERPSAFVCPWPRDAQARSRFDSDQSDDASPEAAGSAGVSQNGASCAAWWSRCPVLRSFARRGLKLSRTRRARTITIVDCTPILVLTARHTLKDRMSDLSACADADDYVSKPFAFAELLSRLHRLLRRAGEGFLSSYQVMLEFLQHEESKSRAMRRSFVTQSSHLINAESRRYVS